MLLASRLIPAILAAALLALSTSACFYSVDSKPVPADIEERRWLSRPQYGAFGSRWSVADGEVVGMLQWQHCVIDRRWTTGTKRVVRSKPNPDLGAVLLLAGGALVATSFLVAPDDPRNAGALALRIGGAALGGTGSGMLFWPKSTKTEYVHVRRHRARLTGECLPEHDRDDLKLVLRLPDNKGLVGELDAKGVARIPIPAGVELPRGVDLQVLVYRVPESAENLLRRRQWVGTLRIEP